MRQRSDLRAAGFSLMELLVVVACLGMILYISGRLFFPMRTAWERQRLQVEARQTARAAADYVSFALRGATDNNPMSQNPRNPLALMVWNQTQKLTGSATSFDACPDGGTKPTCVQLSFNNVTAASRFADPGTDVISLGMFDEPIVCRSINWPGLGTTAANVSWWFEQGCSAYTPPGLPAGNDMENWNRFLEVTGRGSDPDNPTFSKPMVIWDESGNYTLFQITDYKAKGDDPSSQNDTSCTAPRPTSCTLEGDLRPCLWVVASPSNFTVNSPGGQRSVAEPAYLSTGLRFAAFRVCNGWLQQKTNLFNPETDNNCVPGGSGTHAGWTSLLPNVEDLQISYVFRNGQTWNTAQAMLRDAPIAGGCDTTAGVPCQGLQDDPAAVYDSTQVIGFRISVAARSSQALFGDPPNQQPLSLEDNIRPASTVRDGFRRQVVTASALIRNRAPHR